MFRIGVHLELAPHRFTERRLGQHPADGFFHQARRVLLANFLGALLAQPAFIPAVVPVKFLLFLAPGHAHAGGVDDDDMIASVDVGGVNRLVLALQQASCFGSHPAQNLTVGVNHVPLSDDGSGSGDKRTHRSLSAFLPSPRRRRTRRLVLRGGGGR